MKKMKKKTKRPKEKHGERKKGATFIFGFLQTPLIFFWLSLLPNTPLFFCQNKRKKKGLTNTHYRKSQDSERFACLKFENRLRLFQP